MQAINLLKLHADYNRWINERLLDAAQRLTAAERERDLGAFFGSVDGTLNHLLVGDSIWLRRFSSADGPAADLLRARADTLCPEGPLDGTVARGEAEIRARRGAIDTLVSDWVAHLDERQVASTLAYRNTAGRPFRRPLGLLALHFFNHQTHHRGQLSTLLFQAGIDPGITDMLALIPDDR